MNIDRRNWIARSAATVATLAGGIPLPSWAQGAGRALNIAIFPEPNAVLGGYGTTGPSLLVNGNIYEGLLRFDEKLNPQPGLATSWSVSDDQLTYTFKLKPGVKWHDGRPFTADDVAFTGDKIMGELNARFRLVRQSIQSVKALDPLTVEFKLSSPFAAFLSVLDVSTFPVVPKHQYDFAGFPAKQLQGDPIGTGPYKFKEWQRGSYVQLVKNEAYHEAGWPKIDNIYYHIIPDAASRAAAFEAGKIDVLPGGTVEYFDVARLSKLPGVSVTQKGWEKIAPLALIWINNRQPLLQDVRVRRAVMHAIDREALAKVAWYGYATPATGPFNRNVAYATNKVRAYPHDPAAAKKLLAEAGYKGQTVRLLGLPYGETWTRMAEMAKQNLIEAGFKIEIQSADVAATLAMQGNWDYDLAFTYLYQFGDPAIGIARNYVSSEIKKGSAFNNVSGYSNPKVDDLFARGAREGNRAKRAEIYAEVQRILVDDAACDWILDLDFPTVYRSKIDNLVTGGLGINDSLGHASFKS